MGDTCYCQVWIAIPVTDFNRYSHIMGYSEQYIHINSECAYRGKQQKIKS